MCFDKLKVPLECELILLAPVPARTLLGWEPGMI